jgi:hypothetical protein
MHVYTSMLLHRATPSKIFDCYVQLLDVAAVLRSRCLAFTSCAIDIVATTDPVAAAAGTTAAAPLTNISAASLLLLQLPQLLQCARRH